MSQQLQAALRDTLAAPESGTDATESRPPLVRSTVYVLRALVGLVLVLFGMLRAWPHTPIGRRMLNRRPGQLASVPPRRTTSRGTPLDELIGHVGTAKTDLLPSGMVIIDGEKIDAVSIGMPIDAGTKVVVTSVEAGRVHVRAATEDDLSDQHAAAPQSPASLEESIDSFDVE